MFLPFQPYLPDFDLSPDPLHGHLVLLDLHDDPLDPIFLVDSWVDHGRPLGPHDDLLLLLPSDFARLLEMGLALSVLLDRANPWTHHFVTVTAETVLRVRTLAAKPGIFRLPFVCLLYTSPSPRDRQKSRMPSSA